MRTLATSTWPPYAAIDIAVHPHLSLTFTLAPRLISRSTLLASPSLAASRIFSSFEKTLNINELIREGLWRLMVGLSDGVISGFSPVCSRYWLHLVLKMSLVIGSEEARVTLSSVSSASVLRSDSEGVEIRDVPSPESEEVPEVPGESLRISSGTKSRSGRVSVSAQGLTLAGLAPSSMRPFWRACRSQLLIKLQFSSIAEDGIPTSCSSRLISGQSSSTLSDAVFVRNDNTDSCRNPARCSAAYLFSFL